MRINRHGTVPVQLALGNRAGSPCRRLGHIRTSSSGPAQPTQPPLPTSRPTLRLTDQSPPVGSSAAGQPSQPKCVPSRSAQLTQPPLPTSRPTPHLTDQSPPVGSSAAGQPSQPKCVPSRSAQPTQPPLPTSRPTPRLTDQPQTVGSGAPALFRPVSRLQGKPNSCIDITK